MARTRLLEHPQFRDAPPDVVRACRLIVPTAEIVYMGEGSWYLGSVEPSTVRERAGWAKRRRAANIWRRFEQVKTSDPRRAAQAVWMWWEGTLLLQGFAGIEVFTGDPDSRVEEFLRQRDYGWARDLDATYRRWLAEDDQDARTGTEHPDDMAARYSSLLDDRKLRDAHRHVWRTPVSIIKPEPAAPAGAAA